MYQTNAARQAPVGQIDLFRQRLPARPYHSDDLEYGLRIADAKRALKSRYIQFNGPTHKFWLVFDIDRPGALMDWADLGAPPPNIAVINPENHHGHLIYGLEVPIRTAPDGRPEPIRYAGAVDVALAHVLEADLGYSGLICKNPLHDHWQAHVWEPQLYDLDGLASWLDLSAYSDRRKNLPAYGLGRNCTLFDRLRQWAYKAIRQGWPAYDRWYEACLVRAEGYNAKHFTDCPAGPLPYSEVKATAKSVARWTHRNMSPRAFSDYVSRTHTSEIQAIRGAKGGKVSKGGGRPSKREQYRALITEMLDQGFSKSDIAREAGQTRQTISNWIKAIEHEETQAQLV